MLHSSRIRDLLNNGKTTTEIVSLLGCSKSSVSYHRKQMGLYIDKKCAIRYDWKEIQEYYKIHSMNECREKYGFCNNSWYSAIYRGLIKEKPKISDKDRVEKILLGEWNPNTQRVKVLLIQAGLLDNKCYICGIGPEWNRKPLSLQIDHINGNSIDNNIDNLRILCPNCHTQTETYCSKNMTYKRASVG